MSRIILIEQNKAIVARFFKEVENRGNLSVIDEIFTADYVDHAAAPGQTTGPEGVKSLVYSLRTAFPDFNFTIEDTIAEQDKIVARWNAHGTHKGDFFGILPTGRRAVWSGIRIFRLADGKITESWINWDFLGLLQQLGMVPSLMNDRS